jgi:hypothetical protein
MRGWVFPLLGAAVAVLAFAAAPLGQTRTSSSARALPRTPDGHPDLQGTYDIATLTPIERPTANAPLSLTEQQAQRLERAESSRVFERALPSPVNRDAPAAGGNVGGYNNFWIDRGSQVIRVDGSPRSSLIIDPPDGKIPAMTPEGRARVAALQARNGVNPDANDENASGEIDTRAYENPEQRPLGERCLLGFSSTSGPPTMPNYFYNNLKQIVQTPDHILIFVEMVHDARIVRMNQPHLPSSARKWMGDSVGRWEGDTLVIDTTNFTDKTRFRGSSDALHVVERIWRVDDKTLMYRFTVEDPNTWVKPWTGEFPWPATDENIYEYACHEGNYALQNILRGARAAEKRVGAAK